MENQTNSNINVKHEITPTSHKFDANVNVPDKAMNELGLATANAINTLSNCSNKVVDMLLNSCSIIAAPVGELIKGKTAQIELNNQSIYAKLALTKEINMRKHLNYVAMEFNEKEKQGQDIPKALNDTDNLLLIQDNASTTSDENFLKLWAKLYTEEASKPGMISRKAIKLVEGLDYETVKLIEEEIFPYCDSKGYYWGQTNKIDHLLIAQDYGFISINNSFLIPLKLNNCVNIELVNKYFICLYPNMEYRATSYCLTKPAREIKTCLNKKTTDEQFKIMLERINKEAFYWKIHEEHDKKIKLKNKIENNEKFIIYDENKNVISPKDSPFKTLEEFYNSAIKNIEII